MKVGRVLKTAVLVVMLAGCSRVQLLYSQLDWLIPYYLGTYIELSEEQRAAFDGRVARFLEWHCRTQLADYADMLRSADADFQAGTMTRERLEAYGARLEAFWLAMMREASPEMARLLTSASDAQIDKLFAVFEERNAEWLAAFEDETDAERREVYRQRVTEELERWFGPLGPAQQRAVVAWSEHFQPLGFEGLRTRQRWQGRLRELVEHRGDQAAFRAGIDELLTNPGALRSQAVNDLYARNKRAIVELLFEISTHLSEDQRRHLAKETTSIARDLDELACAADASRRQTDGFEERVGEHRPRRRIEELLAGLDPPIDRVAVHGSHPGGVEVVELAPV